MGKLQRIFSDANEKKLENSYTFMKQFNIMVWKKFYNFIKMVIPTLLMYSILSWIFLSIYQSRGFEVTVIIALVGVMIRAGKSNK